MRALLAVLVCTLLVACQNPFTEQPNDEPVATAVPVPETTPPLMSSPQPSATAAFDLVDTYRIGVDDIVLVSVWGNDKLSIQVPVRPDGRISVPLVGDIDAGGKTPEAVSRSIEAALSDYVRDPKVSVILIELRSHEFISRVRVTGAVRSPISVSFRQGMTVLDLVLLAGGLNEFAAPGRARLYRRGGSAGQQVLEVSLDDILDNGQLETNFSLLPGDVLTVPERLF